MILQAVTAAKQLAPACSKLQQVPLLASLWHVSAERSHSISSWTNSSYSSSNEQQESSSWREVLMTMSGYTLCLQGHVQQLAANPSSLFKSRSAAAASTSLAAAAAATAAAPAGTALAFLNPQFGQGRRTGDRYWIRQLGLADQPVTLALIGVNMACFGAQLLYPDITQMFARVDYLVGRGEVWRLLTASFLHGNIVHLGVNMFALFNLGNIVEGTMGSKAFLAVYLGSAVVGNLIAMNLGHGFVTSLGASTSLCGVFGGYMAYRWINRRSWPITRGDVTTIGGTLAINLLLASVFAGRIDTSAHLGGLIGGAAITYLIKRRSR